MSYIVMMRSENDLNVSEGMRWEKFLLGCHESDDLLS
jgi:hypothetical protein